MWVRNVTDEEEEYNQIENQIMKKNQSIKKKQLLKNWAMRKNQQEMEYKLFNHV